MKKFVRTKSKKKLGTSPIIATILLIGLTVVSGAVLYGVTTTFLNQKSQLSLEYTTPTAFTPIVTDYATATTKIDSFNIQVSNPLNEQVILNTGNSHLYNSTNGLITGWSLNSNSSYLLLNGRESTTLTFSLNTIDNSLGLDSGKQVYASFTVERTDGSDPTTFNTSLFTVSASLPVFQFIPYQTNTVDTLTTNNITNVYFPAHSNEEISVNLTGAIWNYGSTDISYQKTVQFFTNTSVFNIADSAATQIVTIPSSTTKVVPDANNVCVVGDACVNITIPITKYNLTKVDVHSTTDYYPGYLAITGMDFIPFQLDLKVPTIKITLENTGFANRGFWGGFGRRSGCFSFPTFDSINQVYNQITYDGNPYCADTKTVTFDIWNLLNIDNNATITIVGLNTTAFTLYTSANTNSWRNNGYSSDPQYVNLPAPRPSKWGRFNNPNSCTSNNGCNTVTWGISRNALIDSNGNSTGIMAGTYPVQIMDTQTGYSITVDLIISPYYKTIHVASLTGSYSKQSKTVQYVMTVKDDSGKRVNNVQIVATYSYPNGNKIKSTTENPITNWFGVATFSNYNPKSGANTFQITDLQAPTQRGWFRWFSPTFYIYDPTADTPSPATVTVYV